MNGFFGEYNVNLDDKGRIALPSKIRPRDEDGSPLQLTLVPGLEGCLALYTPSEWGLLKSSLNSFSYGALDSRAYKRYLYPKMAEVTPDKQGRFLIPSNLIAFAGLRDQALVIGVDTLIEIWNPDKYAEFIANREKTGTIEEISERLFGSQLGSQSGFGSASESARESDSGTANGSRTEK